MNRRIVGEVIRRRKLLVVATLACAIAGLPGCNEEVVVEGSTANFREDNPDIDVVDLSGADQDAVLLGGRLYDNWMKATGVTFTPTVLNPMYTKLGGTDTNISKSYRCRRCHGWDYAGTDQGTSLLDARANYTVEELAAFLGTGISTSIYSPTGTVEDVHKFGGAGRLSTSQLTALAMFVKFGTIDTSPYINSVGIATGHADLGKALYEGDGGCSSSSCHKKDGKGINFGTLQAPEYVGDLGNEDPWEVLHKVRFGDAADGTAENPDMPSLYEVPGLTLHDAVDITTYTRSLPEWNENFTPP